MTRTNKKKTGRRRGKRSSEAQLAHTEKYIAKKREDMAERTEVLVAQGILLGAVSNLGSPSSLPTASVNRYKILQIHSSAEQQAFDIKHNIPSISPHLVLRFQPVCTVNPALAIINAWDHFKSLSPACHALDSDNHSSTPVYHFGVWKRSNEKPVLTKDSEQSSKELNLAVDSLIHLIRMYVLDPLHKRVRVDVPALYEQSVKCHERVQHSLYKELSTRSALDLGPIALALAIRDSGDETLHFEATREVDHFAYDIPLGEDFTGGEWCAPQLGLKIPLFPAAGVGIQALPRPPQCTSEWKKNNFDIVY